MNNEIIQLKAELRKRSKDYIKNKETNRFYASREMENIECLELVDQMIWTIE